MVTNTIHTAPAPPYKGLRKRVACWGTAVYNVLLNCRAMAGMLACVELQGTTTPVSFFRSWLLLGSPYYVHAGYADAFGCLLVS